MKKINLFILLIFTCSVYSQEKLKIFNATISSSDVRGKNTYGPVNFVKVSAIIDDPIVSNSYFELLGQFVKSDHLKNLDQLIDLATFKTDFPILDELDMDYYSNYAIDNILDPKFESDKSYLEFREAFLNAKNVKEMKAVLFERNNRKWKLALFESKYEFVNESNFYNLQAIKKEVHFSIEAKVKASLQEKNIDVNGELGVALQSLIEKNIAVSGLYKEIQYRSAYRTVLFDHLSKYVNQAIGNDIFSKRLKEYFDDEGAGIISSIALLKLELNYDKTKINLAEIKAIVTAKGKTKAIDEISADIYGNLSLSKTYEGQTQISSIYNLKYGYDSNLESLQTSKK